MTKFIKINFLVFILLALPMLGESNGRGGNTKTVATDPGYAMAIRGNGDAHPAHWGAVARVLETFGMPKAAAGGSSATLVLFYLNQLAANTWVFAQGLEESKLRSAFLMKLMEGIQRYLMGTRQGQTLLTAMEEIERLQKMDLAPLATLKVDSSAEAVRRAIELVNTLRSIGFGVTPKVEHWISLVIKLQGGGSLSGREAAELEFYSKDIYTAIKTFGSFNPRDPDLFAREGIINFEMFAENMGRVAGFLRGNWNAKTKRLFNQLVERTGLLKGQIWQDVANQHQEQLKQVLDSYFAQSKAPNPAHDSIGTHLPVLISTSVLIDSAATEARDMLARYHLDLNRESAASFLPSNSEDVKFGYWWGGPIDLERVGDHLRANFPNDEKSRRFLPLYGAKGPNETPTWREVMALSQAEPGLSRVREFSSAGVSMVSAGGWSDLNPVLVLKALGSTLGPASENGFKDVILVTRRGGDSVFAQGVAKRMLGFDRPWDLLVPGRYTADELAETNRVGDPNDNDTLWGKLYNRANPKSSLNLSDREASGLLTTNWDGYSIGQIPEKVRESYFARFEIPNRAGAKELRDQIVKAGGKAVIKNYPD